MKINMNGIYKDFGKKEVLKGTDSTAGNGVYGLHHLTVEEGFLWT